MVQIYMVFRSGKKCFGGVTSVKNLPRLWTSGRWWQVVIQGHPGNPFHLFENGLSEAIFGKNGSNPFSLEFLNPQFCQSLGVKFARDFELCSGLGVHFTRPLGHNQLTQFNQLS